MRARPTRDRTALRPILRPSLRPALGVALALLLAACASGLRGTAELASGTAEFARGTTAPQEPVATWAPAAPTELFAVVRVVDGDTLHVRRGDSVEKLRLLSVDTEEKLSGRANVDPLKPETVFGQQCADWAVDFFARESLVDGVSRVGLLFPEGREQRDVYGRLLCHVLLPDGTDFNLLLVERGKSPYFNKYGDSRLCDAAFRAAQARARAAAIGIWDPATNAPEEPGGPAAIRPYDRLLPWWELRARAIDEYRALAAEPGALVAAADEPDSMAALLARADGAEVRIFGALDRIFDEDDGSVTLLLRGDRRRAFRARVPADRSARLDRAALEASREPFVQNYLWITGRLRADRSGFDMVIEPDDVAPAEATAAATGAGS